MKIRLRTRQPGKIFRFGQGYDTKTRFCHRTLRRAVLFRKKGTSYLPYRQNSDVNQYNTFRLQRLFLFVYTLFLLQDKAKIRMIDYASIAFIVRILRGKIGDNIDKNSMYRLYGYSIFGAYGNTDKRFRGIIAEGGEINSC